MTRNRYRTIWVSDTHLRRFCDLQLGNIMVTGEAIHRTVDGRLLLVVHGDQFDGITRCHRWVALTGDIGYDMLLAFNRWFNRGRRLLRLPYWSLSAYVKRKVKRAVNFSTAFETALAHEARRRGLLGRLGFVDVHVLRLTPTEFPANLTRIAVAGRMA